ncbi:hypothetical protein PVK06_004574 [Gossypium arboreum]|uniref:Uncharacterized protein n=1 Tax=Gossypium arboreum TaxID=29729 RepID=A0ABR0QSM0_GOSAR|nr:hypothetical protein PVK06_004574 [Gossypium arboreum]
MTSKRLNYMITNVCVEGTKWTVLKNDCYTIDKELPQHSDPSPISSPPKPNDVAPSNFKNSFEQKVVKNLEGYVRRRDKAIKKSHQKKSACSIPAFPVFSKQLLLESDDEDNDEELTTAEKEGGEE